MIAIMLPAHLAELLPFSDRDVVLADQEAVFFTGDVVRHVFVVRDGGVQLLRRHPGGSAIVLQRVRAGGLVAEASLFAQCYHCEAVAQGSTRLARIPKTIVLEHHLQRPLWLQAFAGQLASEVQRMRGRAELLSFKRVGDRLDAWLTLNGGQMPERGRWGDWADELGVSPEALYRELAKRRH